eukprot:scaffold15730_cov65-Phaeocystis_antarctica.AAC.5
MAIGSWVSDLTTPWEQHGPRTGWRACGVGRGRVAHERLVDRGESQCVPPKEKKVIERECSVEDYYFWSCFCLFGLLVKISTWAAR